MGSINCLLFNPFPNKPWILRVCSTSLLKTQWEKEILLVTSNFSFIHCFFFSFGEFSAIFIKIVGSASFSLKESRICHVGKGERFRFICKNQRTETALFKESYIQNQSTEMTVRKITKPVTM